MTKGAAQGQPAKRFRPTFWASLCTLVALAVLLWLGTWQLQRLEQKETLIAQLEAQAAGPPIALPGDLSDPALDFTLVQVAGRFVPAKALRLANRIHDGKVGAHLVAPFVANDGRGLLVDRGWVPIQQGDAAPGADRPPAGEQQLTGYLRHGGWSGMAAFRPENAPDKGLFNWPDLAAMAALVELPNAIDQVYLVLVPASDDTAEGLPIPQPPPVDLPNNHLQYAITWYALALVLLVIYIIYHWRTEDS